MAAPSSSSTLYQPPPQEVKPPSQVGTETDIKTLLRLCNEPLTLFGEDSTQRKIRLQKHIKLYFSSFPQPAVAYLNKVNGIGTGPKRTTALGAEAGTEVRVADAFGPAGSAVVSFRRKLLDASLELQKERIAGLRTLFAQHRTLVSKLVGASSSESAALAGLSEEAAAALLAGKAPTAEQKARTAHANAHVNSAVTDMLRSAAKTSAAAFVRNLRVSVPGEENVALGGVLFSTMTTAAVNPNFVVPLQKSKSASGSEVAVGYADGRVWCYNSGNGELTLAGGGGRNDGRASAAGVGFEEAGEEGQRGRPTLSTKGQARVTSLCWRPTTAPSEDTSSTSDFLFVARRQNEVEMWRIDRSRNDKEGDDDDDDDNAEDEVTASKAAEEEKRRRSITTSSTSKLVATFNRHVAFVNRLACDPTGSLLVSTSDDMTACLWDVATASSVLSLTVGDPPSASSTTAVSPYFLYQQDGHDTTSVSNTVCAVDFHPDGSAFATTDAAGVCLLWDARSGTKMARTPITHTGRATCVKWFPSGFHIATAGDDGIVHAYDTRMFSSTTNNNSNAKRRPLFSISAHTDSVTSLAVGGSYFGGRGADLFVTPSIAACGKYLPQWLVSCGLDGRVSMWSADDGSHLRTLEGGPIRAGVGETARGGGAKGAGGAAGGGGVGGAGGASAFRFALPVVVRTWAPSAKGGGEEACSVGLITGARDRTWCLWSPGGGESDPAAAVLTKSFDAVTSSPSVLAQSSSSGGGPQAKTADRISDDSDSSSDDDDGLAALRKKPRVEVAAPTAATTTAATLQTHQQQQQASKKSASDSDSDDDALAGLRKK